MQLVHAGFDTIDVAFQGAFDQTKLDILAGAREEAEKAQEPTLIELGPEKVPVHVASHGMGGGFAFCMDTGRDGELWRVKNNACPDEWNVFVSPRAASVAVLGFHGIRDRLQERLAGMGCRVRGHSVNRVDFAVDFLASGFDLRPTRFVAHARTKVAPYWGKQSGDPHQPSAVLRGRRCESVTIGKMPGRQIIVYDKRRAAIEKQERFWFEVWGLDRRDTSHEVWRVEVRAGKRELLDKWRLRTFAEVEDAFGDVCVKALDDVRYLAGVQSDSNVTRQCLHPLWETVQAAVSQCLTDYRCGLTRDQLREGHRAQAIDQYEALIRGNAGALAAILDLKDEEMIEELVRRFDTLVSERNGKPTAEFEDSRRRAARRVALLAEGT